MLFGRVTYLDLVGHWLATTEPNPFTPIIRDTAKYVASRTLSEPLPHPNSHLLTDAVDGVRALKRDGEGDIVVLGSGALVRDLAAAGLVDAYVLERLAESDHPGRLAYLERTVGDEAVLTPETTALFRAVADRWAGNFVDVVRLGESAREFGFTDARRT